MPSAWYWTTIAELLAYGSTLVAGAHAYCAAHAGSGVAVVLQLLDGSLRVGCSR